MVRIALLAMFLALPVVVLAEDSPGYTWMNWDERQEQFGLFSECEPMGLHVYADPAVAKRGMTEENVRAMGESRLRSARLYRDSPGSPHLALIVNTSGPVVVVTTRFMKMVADPKSLDLKTWRLKHPYLNGPLIGLAITWHVSHLSLFDEIGHIRSIIAEQIDHFLVEYLRVNEQACEGK